MLFDLTALSSLAGCISIACWIVVQSPQIIENFRRSSAQSLSIRFIFVWLIGDFFNVLGSVMQGVLPTMIILALYYTLADMVLLLQCFYYRGFTLKDIPEPPSDATPATYSTQPNETAPLLADPQQDSSANARPTPRREPSLFKDHGTQLSPAKPLHQGKRDADALKGRSPAQRGWKAVLFNLTAVLVVIAAGTLGWYLSTIRGQGARSPRRADRPRHGTELHFNPLGQLFGYICAVLYLSSRVPQLLLNYRRKSTEGVSMLFFVFASMGNLTYVLSILAFEPVCWVPDECRPGEVGRLYGTNLLINLSWLMGSFGTFLLDCGTFTQYFRYRKLAEDRRLQREGQDE